ncbi:MAG: UDP-N-acetylglucosamine diphosphorylase / glucose-phosphate thymidylyltransferase [Patescibacteria group bacterium]|nr:UDP-N-acetylglucosamine diphosphorylase / glucose-phosphate thymidylyltransferase [Patescibacteria group bacterium]
MKLVILAAGKGKRMGESSNHTPKPILKYKGKTLIHHKLEQLPADIDEIIIVIGHLGEKIVEAIGHSYDNSQNGGSIIPITYIEQKEQLGSAHSLWQAKDIIGNNPFLVIMGDDLYSKEDLEEMVAKHKDNNESWVALVEKREKHIPYGKCILDEEGYLIDFRDDPHFNISENLMYTGACILTPEVFDLPMVKVNPTEYGLPHTFIQEQRHNLSNTDRKNVHVVYTRYWKRITTPEDLLN